MSSTQKVITDSDKSPLVQVLTLMFLVIAILACLVRTGTKIHMIKALRVDDLLVIAASVSRQKRPCIPPASADVHAHRFLPLASPSPFSWAATMDLGSIPTR
jgi:hypothetical protein